MSRLAAKVPAVELLLAAMGVVAGTSLYGGLRGGWLIPLCVLGAAMGLLARLVADRISMMEAEWFALSIGLVLALGFLATGPLPTPSAFSDFFRGLTDGWADLLSSVPPTPLEGHFHALPYLLAWLATTMGVALARSVRFPGVGAIGPMAVFGLGLLFSQEARTVALIQGALLVVIALLLGWVQQRQFGLESDEHIGNTTMQRRRVRYLGAAAVLTTALVGAPLLAPLVPLDGRERFDLRDRLEPPWDPLEEASPLAQIKSNYLGGDPRQDVVFVARGDALPQRWSLATLAAFDGQVWTVGDSRLGGEAPFSPIDRLTPADPAAPVEPWGEVVAEVEIVDLDGPWLPIPGRASSLVHVDGPEAADYRFNRWTGTAAAPAGAADQRYVVQAMPFRTFPDSTLRQAALVPVGELGLEQQAAEIRDRSATFVQGVDDGWQRIEAFRDQLTDDGFYLATEEVRPGHSWARLSEFFAEDELFGNEEQYAAAAAIISRNAGYSTRVVVGYVVRDYDADATELSVTRNDADAWIEVQTEEYGWVPVDVTPDRSKEPTLDDAGTRTETVAAPNIPPPPPPPRETELEQRPEEEPTPTPTPTPEVEPTAGGVPVWAVAGGAPLGLLLVGFGSVVGMKAGRRRRRQRQRDPNTRVAGAWYEANDRLVEAGAGRVGNTTPAERADQLVLQFGAAERVRDLAARADEAAFRPGGVDDDTAAAAWDDVGDIVVDLRSGSSMPARVKRLADPRPLLKKDPVRS